jgi:hypothetical protein
MVSEGFPSKVPAWRKGVRIYPVDGGGVVAAKKGWRVGRSFESEEIAWKVLAEEHGQDGKSVAPKGPAVPDRPHLDRLEREGLPDRRGGADVSAEDFIATFGFRGVEFGLWIPNDERQTVLNFAYDALHDLADVLIGIRPASVWTTPSPWPSGLAAMAGGRLRTTNRGARSST